MTLPNSTLAPLVIDARAQGTTLLAVPGQTIEVCLTMHVNAGYLWVCAEPAVGIDVVRHEGLVANEDMGEAWDGRLGGDALSKYVLVAAREGVEQVRLAHKRPFGEHEPIEFFEFTVAVRALADDLTAE